MTKPPNPFRYFDSSPEVIRLVVMMYVRYPLSLRNVEDLLFERGIDICHETVRLWWNRHCQGKLDYLPGAPTSAESSLICSVLHRENAIKGRKNELYLVALTVPSVSGDW